MRLRRSGMIVSHQHRFIFIKTEKTAGTSIEAFLSPHCGAADILTPVYPPVPGHVPRNFEGWWNPIPEIALRHGRRCGSVLRRLLKRRKFYNHMPATVARCLISPTIWDGYFKFCVERNPWDKTLSHYHMLRDQARTTSLDEYLRKSRLPINYPMYLDNRGALIVDEVVKYESLMPDLDRIFRRLGIPFDHSLGVDAKSQHRKDRTPYRDVFTPEQKAIVETAFRPEIELHGYQF
jgi:hypothetical protein